MNKKYNYTSLRQFSWSGSKKKNEVQNLIEETVNEWYDAKHRKQSKSEIEFINSIKITTCPFCHQTVMKNGHRSDGIQTYKCSSCHKRFTPLTGTIFDNHKIPISEWIEYLTHLFEFHSVKTSANDNRNSDSTGRYWIQKVFAVLENIQEKVMLKDNIFIDETYVPVIQNKKIKIKENHLKGLSRNQLDIATATDGYSSIFIYMKHGKPTQASVWRCYGKHIKEESTLIHDGEPSHNELIDRLCLKSIVYKSEELKGLRDDKNPLFPINNLHSLLKRFMRSHGSYNREDLQDWLNLFYFIVNGPKDKNDKVQLFIELAVKNRKLVRFRDNMKKSKTLSYS